tara:strand:- start:1695 stop:2936 length:1242 start_codon:yes stop_codon:yes gene_type:complete
MPSLKHIPRGIIYHKLSYDFINIFRVLFSKLNNENLIKKFEDKFAKYNDSKFCVAFPFARMGIYYSLKAKNFPQNSEIIMPPITIKAILDVVLATGLKPIFVDINENDFSYNLADLKSKINENTKSILISYLYGIVPDVDEIIKLSKENDLYILEDFSQCLNGNQDDVKTGNFGDVGIYSSSTTKTLDTYGGGLCVTNNSSTYKKLLEYQSSQLKTNRIVLFKKIVQDFVRNLVTNIVFFNLITIWLLKLLDLLNKNDTVKYVGSRSTEKNSKFPKEYFYKFSSFQAKIGLETISDVNIYDSKRIQNVDFINKNLTTSTNKINTQNNRNVYWQYLFIFDKNDRKKIVDTFKKNKVDTAQTSLPLLPYMEDYGFNQETPTAKKIHENGYFIPSYHRLNNKDLLRISSAVDDILG